MVGPGVVHESDEQPAQSFMMAQVLRDKGLSRTRERKSKAHYSWGQY